MASIEIIAGKDIIEKVYDDAEDVHVNAIYVNENVGECGDDSEEMARLIKSMIRGAIPIVYMNDDNDALLAFHIDYIEHGVVVNRNNEDLRRNCTIVHYYNRISDSGIIFRDFDATIWYQNGIAK